jgi:secreted trypsin-like serine protease
MFTYRIVLGPFRATMAATLVAAVVCVLAFVQSGPAAQAIVGGTETPDGDYPFVAALLNTKSGNTPTAQQFCGGSLIDKDSVLTAAHCFVPPGGVGVSPQPIRVIVGRTNLESTKGKVRPVSSIYIHPSYNPPKTNMAYDVAVLQLGRAVEGVVKGVDTPRLADEFDDDLETPGLDATVAGWGSTVAQPAKGPGGKPSKPSRMHEALVPLVSDAEAKMTYKKSYYDALMVAAGEDNLDSCQGDSGGPLFDQEGLIQIGIVSFGNGCGAADNPGVYTEVNNPNIRDFIDTKAR